MPAALRDTFAAHAGQFTAVSPGDTLDVASFGVTVHGGEHAVIHQGDQRRHSLVDLGEILDEAAGVELGQERHLDAVIVAVQAPAAMPLRHARQEVRRFEIVAAGDPRHGHADIP